MCSLRRAAGGLSHYPCGHAACFHCCGLLQVSCKADTVGRQHVSECCGLLQVGWNTKLWAEEFALALEHEDSRFPRDLAAAAQNPPQAAGEGHGPASGRFSAPLVRRQVTCTALVAAPDIVQQSCSPAGCCFACPLHLPEWSMEGTAWKTFGTMG